MNALKKSSCAKTCASTGTLRIQNQATVSQANDRHPCYDEAAHKRFARIHLPVARGCNIQCNYCNRKYDCANESRPGVTSGILTPEEACARVTKVLSDMPELSVAGFAGPGDPLANPAKTFETMALLKERHPDLILCVSTNGLTLSRHLDDLVSLGVQYVTVTVNALEPTVAEKIYPWVYAEKKRWKGLSGAKLLLEKQREGIEAVIGAGLFCKINSVLIPEVNDTHLTEVNQFVSGLGVYMHNIMPLISDPIHGTVFGLQGVPSATAEQVEAVRDTCEGRARVMRHCRQCRADAVGLLGA